MAYAGSAAMRVWVRELFMFGLKQARACLFPAMFFAILALSHHLPLGALPRYDFIFLAAIAAQLLLLALRIETKKELVVLCGFHLVGLVLELFKTHPAIGSWSYPEAAFFRIGTVPLYSGFMYAAVASYMIQAWRLLGLRLRNYPPYSLSIPLSVAIYVNFFSHHFLPDFRWLLTLAVVVVFWRTTVLFTVTGRERSMPLVLAFALIGFFIWVAENISTFLGAWTYPDQQVAWTVVSFGKVSSWCLLVIISFIIVADLKYVRGRRDPNASAGGRQSPAAGAHTR